ATSAAAAGAAHRAVPRVPAGVSVRRRRAGRAAVAAVRVPQRVLPHPPVRAQYDPARPER
ncbi:hypothetical protein, partial [Nocardia wallacei]|uniref:hypothetical protein n=1 Tax=Nocardia wallacei TaxID=480035 RepID=UPI0024581D7D